MVSHKKSPNLMGMYNFIRMLLNNSRLNTTYVQKNSKIKNSDSKFNTSLSFFSLNVYHLNSRHHNKFTPTFSLYNPSFRLDLKNQN
jgi:hypothetical protein